MRYSDFHLILHVENNTELQQTIKTGRTAAVHMYTRELWISKIHVHQCYAKRT